MKSSDEFQFKLLGLHEVIKYKGEQHNTLDELLKVLLEEKTVSLNTKLNICTFIEEQSSLFLSVTDAEQAFATLKNLYEVALEQESLLLQGKCLTSMTALLVQTVVAFQEEEILGLFTELLTLLVTLVKQLNGKNSYTRSVAANCLLELELCFPELLIPCMNMLYTTAVGETSTAHQQYLCLLTLVIKHSLLKEHPSDNKWGISTCVLRELLSIAVAWPESSALDTSFPNMNQVISFVVDQLSLCTSEGSVWITEQLSPLMRSAPNYLPLLQPLLLASAHTHYLPLLQVVHSFWREFHQSFVQNQYILQLHSLNAAMPCLPTSHRLVALDLLADFIAAVPSAHILDECITALKMMLPGPFDGPESQLKKLLALATVFQNHSCASVLLSSILESIRREILYHNTVKLKSILSKASFRCVSDLRFAELNSRIPSLISTVVEDDKSFVPFALNLIERRQFKYPCCPVASQTLSLLLQVATQPPVHITHIDDVELKHITAVFWAALQQSEQTLEWVKVILTYLLKYVVRQEVCVTLSWASGHGVLSLCYFLMTVYDTTDFYFELCEVLKGFMIWSQDIDLQDRAQLYYALVANHANKKLKVPKERFADADISEETFKSTCAVRKIEKPFIRLSETRSSMTIQKQYNLEYDYSSLEDLLSTYYNELKKWSSSNGHMINCFLNFTQECGRNIQVLEGLAIIFSVPSSWGHIEPAMVGHISKRTFCEDKEAYKVEIVCFPDKPYPVTAQVRAEFSVRDIFHVCHLEPCEIDFMSFFSFMPIEIKCDKSHTNSEGQEELFELLWTRLQLLGCESVMVLHIPSDKLVIHLTEKLAPFRIGRKDGSNTHLIGIFLPPAYHLLIKFYIDDERSIVKFATEDVYISALAGSFFQQWS